MILFSNKPDALLDKIISESLEVLIQDYVAIANYSEIESPWLDPDTVKLFGGPRTLSSILTKLRDTHTSEQMYEVSPYYFYLIHEILTTFVELYNDGINMIQDDLLQHSSGAIIETIDIDMITGFLFPDLDFLMEPSLANQIKDNPQLADFMGFTPGAINIARRISPDNQDLWIRPCDTNPGYLNSDPPDWFDEIADEFEQDG